MDTIPTRHQRTIAREAGLRGVSFLSGLDVELTFRPADAGAGVRFVRADLPGRPAVPALVDHVIPRQRRTAIQRDGAVVEMVEHVMAALAGLGVDNCEVEIDGPETPGCDGSSLAFAEAIEAAGIVEQAAPRETLTIDRPITVREGQATLTAFPTPAPGLTLSYNLQYGPDSPIGDQSRFLEVNPSSFRVDLAPCRTFLLEAEAKALRGAGIGRRTSEADLIIFGPDGPIKNSLRFPDEPVRHKILDLVGDLALLGKDIAGHVVAHRSGHSLNATLVRALIEAADASRSGPPAGPDRGPDSLDIKGILAVLPHRFPFLLIDRVVEMEGDRRLVALKNVSANEPFFQGHWPDRPVMPGVLILEAMAQSSGVLISRSLVGRPKVAVIAAVDGVKLRRQVTPGDQIWIEATTTRLKPRTAEMQTVARVGGEVVAEARFRFVIVENHAA